MRRLDRFTRSQFSLRGLVAAADQWYLVCFAFNLKRIHTQPPLGPGSALACLVVEKGEIRGANSQAFVLFPPVADTDSSQFGP